MSSVSESREVFVQEIDYVLEDDSPIIRIFGRTPGGLSTAALCLDFRPYFFCMPDAGSDARALMMRVLSADVSTPAHIVGARLETKRWLGKEVALVRVTIDNPRNVRAARSFLEQIPAVKETFEKDILFKRRFIIDKGISPLGIVRLEGEPVPTKFAVQTLLQKARVEGVRENYLDLSDMKILAYDIEVATRGEPDPAVDPVIMIGLADSKGTRVLTYGRRGEGMETCQDEKEMISRFVSTVHEGDYDLLVGYNSDSFDLPYIRARARQAGLRLRLGRDSSEVSCPPGSIMGRSIIRGRINVDLYPPVRRMMNLPAYTLSQVCFRLFNRKKEELTANEILRLWEGGTDEGAARIARYCASDVEATAAVAAEVLPTLVELSKHTRQLLADVSRMGQSQMVEWLLIREAYRRGDLVPNRPTSPELARRRRETYEGGYVLEPRKGLQKNIVSLDFRSLYPTIIVTHNVDISTLDCDCCAGRNLSPTGHHFCQKTQGFIPSIVGALVERRAQIKGQLAGMDPASRDYKRLDAMQNALKILANSFYGYSGYAPARWYSKECAESVAAWGRHYIRNAIEAAEKLGFQVLYSDTDSVFITRQPAGRDSLVREAKDFLERMNSSLPGIIELEYQSYYPRDFFVTKKRYALIDEGGKILTRGLEVVRRDWSPLAKETQRRVLEAILKDGDPSKAAEEVRRSIRAVSERSVELRDLVISTRMTKALNSYEAKAPHVALAKRMVEGGEDVDQGATIDYVVHRGSGKVGDRAQPVDQARIQDYDVEYYIRSQILPPSMRIMSAFGFREEDLRFYKTKQKTLDGFASGGSIND